MKHGLHFRPLEPIGHPRCPEAEPQREHQAHGHGEPEGGRHLGAAEVLSLDERGADPELGEDFDQARTAEDEAQQAPFVFIEVFAQDPDEAELDEDLDPDIQGLPLDGVREIAALALAHLATLTARVSRITVTLTCPG